MLFDVSEVFAAFINETPGDVVMRTHSLRVVCHPHLLPFVDYLLSNLLPRPFVSSYLIHRSNTVRRLVGGLLQVLHFLRLNILLRHLSLLVVHLLNHDLLLLVNYVCLNLLFLFLYFLNFVVHNSFVVLHLLILKQRLLKSGCLLSGSHDLLLLLVLTML